MTSDEGKRVMLSYNHKSKDIVGKVKEQLENNGIPVWFDERDMEDNMFDSMAKAVGNAFAVCCFMTPEYENSGNCELELEHAQRRGKRIIPCMVSNRKVWKPSPDGWLNFITGSKIAIDFSGTSGENISVTINKLIDRIHGKSPDSSLPSSSVSQPSDFFLPIKHQYLRNSRIHRMMNEEQSFPIEQSYINLALVETEEQQKKEKKLRQTEHNDAIISTFEEIYGTKTSIDVKDIFEKCKDQTKKVLVLGRAGIGKSTFCRYVSYRWAKGEFWTQYQLAILIRLRLLTSSRYPLGQKYLPVDLVEKEYFPCDTIPDEDREHFKKLCNKGQVLWLLDGYDEFIQNIPEQLKDLFDHILATQHHILTSRPYSIALSYDVEMEITGFTDDNIAKYVEQFFDQIKDPLKDASSEGQKLLNFLKSNPSIWGVAHIPVNLELICSLWSDTEWSETITLTMTALYDKMTEWLCRRYLTKKDPNNSNMVKEEVYDLCNNELAFLERLAFQGMEIKKIILKSALLRQVEKESNWSLKDHPELLNIGILKSLNDKATGSNNVRENDHYFVHLSFQEHFAARHLVNALRGPARQKAIDFIKGKKYNQRFALMLSFASGLLIESDDKQCLDAFWDAILGEPLDLVGLRHVQIVISCFEETGPNENFHRRSELADHIANWIKYAVATDHRKIHSYIENSLRRSASVVNQPKIIETLTQLLSTTDPKKKRNALSLISRIPIRSPHPQLILSPAKALADQESSVRQEACKALGNMDEKAATKDVIDALVKALADQDSPVRWSACRALGKMGEKAATKDVIDALVKALANQESSVRQEACRALGNMDEKAATKDVIDALVKALADQDSPVRWRACEALGKMGEKAATREVIDALVKALRDPDYDVRHWACEAQRNIGEKAATKDMIDALVKALADQNSDGRGKACEALGYMGEKAATKDAIDALVKALADQESSVRQEACNALGEMGEKAATKDVIDALVKALADQESRVRWSACRALGKMGEKAATKDVIDALVKALADQGSPVRWSACRALGKMGEKAATKDVIDALVKALADQEPSDRQEACNALGKMGEKAATKEVIDALVKALADQNSFARSSARNALGKMGEKAATKNVIDALVKALADQESRVRQEACKALGNMDEKAATKDVIDALVKALADQDSPVRWRACEALGKMGEKAATKDVIDALVKALADQESRVRQEACKALGNMDEKAATKDVIDALVKALADQDSPVRWRACEALGKMGEKAATKNVIDALVKALANQESSVRQEACRALGKMGRKAATKEVINALVEARRYPKSDVSGKACVALGKMDEKAAAKDVINGVLIAMNPAGYLAEFDTVLEKNLVSCFTMSLLDSKTVSNLLYLSQDGAFLLNGISIDKFIKVYLDTEVAEWTSVVAVLSLRRGCAITVSENTITVYGNEDPVEFQVSIGILRERLVEAFSDQISRLYLSSEQQSEYEHGLKVTSAVCNIM